MQQERPTRNMTYWREEKPKKSYDWLLMLIVLVLIIVGALV